MALLWNHAPETVSVKLIIQLLLNIDITRYGQLLRSCIYTIVSREPIANLLPTLTSYMHGEKMDKLGEQILSIVERLSTLGGSF